MNPWTALLIGLLLGWLIEYAVDWFFWRRKPTDKQIVTELQDQLQASEARNAELEEQLAVLKSESAAWQTENEELEPQITTAEADATEADEYVGEESHDSQTEDLAAASIGAAAGAAIAAGADDGEDENGGIFDDETMEESAGEPIVQTDVPEDIPPEQVATAAEDTSDDEDLIMAEQGVEDDSPGEITASEADEGGQGDESSNQAEDTDSAKADLIDDAETSTEVNSADQDIAPVGEEGSDAFENNDADSSANGDVSAENMDSSVEEAAASAEGGQES